MDDPAADKSAWFSTRTGLTDVIWTDLLTVQMRANQYQSKARADEETDKSTAGLPQNLQDVVAAIAKHSGGIALKDLEVAKLSAKTLAWLVRSLCKHGFVKAVAEEKLKTKKTTKKEEK